MVSAWITTVIVLLLMLSAFGMYFEVNKGGSKARKSGHNHCSPIKEGRRASRSWKCTAKGMTGKKVGGFGFAGEVVEGGRG